jgi:hypothetical protein
MADQWGADVPVSMPEPLPEGYDSIVPMGGFTMTEFGLFPDLTRADHERLSTPAYQPYDPLRPSTVTVPESDAEEEEWPRTGAGA